MKDCRLCAQNGSETKHERKLQIFPAARPLEFVVIHIFEPLPKTTSGTKTLLIWLIITQNSPVQFSLKNLHRHILRLYSSTARYSRIVFQTMYCLTAAHSLSESSLQRYASSYRLRSWWPSIIICKQTIKSSNITVHWSQDYVIMILRTRKIGIRTYNSWPMRTPCRRVERVEYPRLDLNDRVSHNLQPTRDRLTCPANDMQREVTTRHKPCWLLQRIDLMKAAVISKLSTAWRRYKCDFDKNVWRQLMLKVED